MKVLWGNPALQIPQQLSHAYIIAGDCGSGRGTLIRHLCKLALCTSEVKPCGSCRDCGKVQRIVHPDVVHLGVEKPMNVDAVRQMRQDVFLRPNEGSRKIYILHNAEDMNANSQNALLKILEEPPLYALFFLITREGGGVIDTIRSRCQQLTLRPVTDRECRDFFTQNYGDNHLCEEAIVESQGFLGRGVALIREEQDRKLKSDQAKEGKRISKKELVPPPEPTPLEPWARAMEQALCFGTESELLEACQPLRKLDKNDSMALLDLLSSYLAQRLAKEMNPVLLSWIQVLEQGNQSIFSNVKGEQIACWLCASLWNKRSNT